MGPLLTAGCSVLQVLIVLATICMQQRFAEKTGMHTQVFTHAALRRRNGLPMIGSMAAVVAHRRSAAWRRLATKKAP